MNKSVYLGLSILNISKIVMYEIWYDYVKPKYRGTEIEAVYIKQKTFTQTLQKMLKQNLYIKL